MIVFYISGHGFGHAARDIEVINALLARQPDVQVHVRTSAPRWLFDLTVRGRVGFHAVETDVGVVQRDSLTPDIPGWGPPHPRFMFARPPLSARERLWSLRIPHHVRAHKSSVAYSLISTKV